MSACKSCQQDVMWAQMAETRKNIPLEPGECQPHERGAIFVVRGETGTLWGYSLGQLARKVSEREGVRLERARELAAHRYPAHLAHFTRCPYAGEHRGQQRLRAGA